MTADHKNKTVDYWVKTLELDAELVTHLLWEDQLLQGTGERRPSLTKIKDHNRIGLSFYDAALEVIEQEDQLIDLLAAMRDPAFVYDPSGLGDMFLGKGDEGLVIEDTLRYPHTPYIEHTRGLSFAALRLVAASPESKNRVAMFKLDAWGEGKESSLVKLERLKHIIDYFPVLAESFTGQGFSALAQIAHAFISKSRASFDKSVALATERLRKGPELIDTPF